MKLGMTAGRNVGLDQERARLSAKVGPESRVSGQEARHTKRPFHASGLGADGGDLGAGGRGGGAGLPRREGLAGWLRGGDPLAERGRPWHFLKARWKDSASSWLPPRAFAMGFERSRGREDLMSETGLWGRGGLFRATNDTSRSQDKQRKRKRTRKESIFCDLFYFGGR